MNVSKTRARNAYKYLVQAVVGMFLSFITLPIYTRIISPAEFGEVALAQVFAVFAVSFANFGILEIVERNFFQYSGSEELQGYSLYSCLLFVGLLSIVLLIVSWEFQREISEFMGINPLSHFVFWALLGQIFSNINSYYYLYLKNRAEAGQFATYGIIVSLLNALLGLYLVGWLEAGPIGILYALVTSSAVGLILLSITFLKKYQPGISVQILKDTLYLAFPMTPRILTGVISNQFDKYLIRQLGAVSAVGLYSVAQRIAYFVFFFMTILQNVFGPEVYKRLFSQEENNKLELGRYLIGYLYISVFFATCLALFGPELANLILGREYANSGPIVAVLAAFYAVQFPGKITGKQLVYAKKTALISVLSIVSLVLSVIFVIPLVWKWGALGAAWGILLSGILTNLTSFLVAQKYHRVDWHTNRLWQNYTFLAVAVVITSFISNSGTTYEFILSTKIILLLLYALYGWWLGLVRKNNLKKLIQAAKINIGNR